MSASMLACRFCCRLRYLRSVPIRLKTTSAYYVLFPEVPPDTPETNPLLRVNDFPHFSKINPDKVITGCAKLSIEYDVALGKHLEQMKDPKSKKDFESVFEPIEEITLPIDYAWRTSRNLNFVRGADYQTAYNRINSQVQRAKNERWHSEPLYNAVKEVQADKANLTEFQARLVDTYLREAKHSGIELMGEKKEILLQFMHSLNESRDRYRNRLQLSHHMFSEIIDDFTLVIEFPEFLRNMMALDKTDPSRGPWKVSLNHSIYFPFLEHCSDRELRWNVWQAYQNRASPMAEERDLSNHKIIEDLRLHRQDIAKILGFENYAEMQMETMMAPSLDAVLNMVESFKNKIVPAAEQEVAKLQDFATYEGFRNELQLWDIPYWQRRHKKELFTLDADEVATYFPLPKVLQGLFDLCTTLFGVVVKDCTEEVDRWHTDVRFFKLYNQDDGEYLGAFYLDPYHREGKMGGWVEPGRDAGALLGLQPIAYVNLSLAPPFANRPALMDMTEIMAVFGMFGQVLHQLLSTVPYSEIAGYQSIEKDAQNMTPFMMTMMLHNRHVLKRISCHYETGEQLSDRMVDTVLEAEDYMKSLNRAHQLYVTALDLDLNISTENWQNRYHEIWRDFVPMPLDENNYHPCSLTSLFVDNLGATHYSWLWSQMMAADAYQVFNETGFEDLEKLSPVGKRYRELFLSLAGGVPAAEVFRRFQGRDPSLAALFQYCGLDS